MKNLVQNLWSDEFGQDFVEYTLLVAFICLMVAGIFVGIRDSIFDVTSVTSANLDAAKTASGSS